MPAEALTDDAAAEVTQGAPHRNCQVEPGKDPAAPLAGEIVGDEPGRNRAKTRFADSYHGAGRQECPVAAGQACKGCGQAPDQKTCCGQPDPGKAVSQPA